MKRSFAKIVPSRLMVVGLGTTLFVLCVTAILMLLPGLIGRERLADRLVDDLQSLNALHTDVPAENLDRILFTIWQSNKANPNISYLRFVNLDDGSIFTFEEYGLRQFVGRANPDIWADLISDGKATDIDGGKYEIFRTLSLVHNIAMNLGIDPGVAYEIESQRRLSLIVGSIILATGIGILIMIWQTRQIEEAKGELELVLASTLEPILMVDNNCRLVFANEPARVLLGQPKGKEFRNRPLLSLVQNPDTRDFLSQILDKEQPEFDELETSLPGYSETATFRGSVLDVNTEVGRTLGRLLVLRDVTLEKRLEDKKVSQTIHELKGMLGEVKGLIRQVVDTIDGEAQREQRAFLNICLEKLGRCYDTVAVMVRSIVSAFKPRSLELRPRHSDLIELLKVNVSDFNSTLESERARGLMLELALPDKLPTIYCDSNAVSRVIINVLQNAVQHCPDGTVLVSAKDNGEMIEVLVSDTGSGILSENLERIFEPHVSFRRGGSGMGLSICRDFIRAHGGEIWAESKGRGKGSTFHFTLPKSKPVIVSSDLTLVSKLDAECRKSGYYPLILDDFLTVTRRVADVNPNAILLDLDMQDTISGFSLAYRLKKTSDTAKIPIIALAANVADAQSELGKYEGISLERYLCRDFTPEELGAAMGTVEAYWYLAAGT
ncbi:MAG: hypothetical protein C4532_01515 [Candidatus Abyssobacteria bacterium SURF_17]|jgi:signal transduction histidine kinase|uniref:histidine kinase n=1 Tax=Candidatus Abyssobacteria bacterium SURF_17 TaxID=2093361 RepID=A0A419F8K3_9BACT|nr:MAG: hypothetical protein C4532_01515 [Candidatus Abyssubacteria bacterium SURF_17]